MRPVPPLLAALLLAPVVALCAESSQSAERDADTKTLRIFIFAGQSNMEGPAHIRTIEGIGDDPVTAPMLKDMLGHLGFIRGTMQQIIAIYQMPNQ